MRGLFLYVAVACLALASGAPTDEAGKVHTKNFHFDKKDGIFALKPFAKDELVYAVCEGSDADKKCQVYVESANGGAAQSCDVNLKYTGRAEFKVALFNAGNSRAVIAVRDSDTQIRLISVNLKDCQVKEVGIDVPKQAAKDAGGPLKVVVVPHEKDYDFVYQNKDLCHDFLCKATIDYEGNVVKTPNGFLVADLDKSYIHQIEAAKDAYLVSETHGESTSVYLVRDGDEKPNTLYSGARGAVGLSAEENELSFCAHVDNKLTCKQYDAEGKTTKFEVDFPTGDGRMEYLDALNLEKGLLTLAAGRSADTNDRSIFAAHFDEQGKQVKSVIVDLNCDKKSVVFPKLYKSANGEYCVSSICLAALDTKEKSANFSRSTKCFVKTELF